MAVISCRQAVVKYGDRLALKGITCDVDAGSYICIMGANGSGKSTLLRAMLGLVPVHSGSIVLGDGLKRADIGFAPQQVTVRRDFPATVMEVVLSGCLSRRGWRPYYNAEEKEIAAVNLARLNITDCKGSLFCNLSGGQQQRAVLARAFCAANKLMMLDEPARNLDEHGERALSEILDQLHQEKKMTLVVVTHDRDMARHAQRILYLEKGQCVYWGKPEHCEFVQEGESHD